MSVLKDEREDVKFIWSSLDNSVASVNASGANGESGAISAQAAGSAKIKVAVSDATANPSVDKTVIALLDITALGADGGDPADKYLALPDVTVGAGFTAALAKDGKVYAWGRNNYGQLGDKTTEDRMFPLPVDFNFEPGKYIVKIAASLSIL